MIVPKLIINADDFGYNENLNAAIISCFQKGLINSTTLMANMGGFEEAVSLAMEHNITDKIGLHVNLNEGKPLTDFSGTGLVDQNGEFRREPLFSPRFRITSLTKNKIKLEIETQYDRLIQAGIYPSHIDSHQQVHTLPWISSIFASFAKRKKQKLRMAPIKRRKNVVMTICHVLLNVYLKKEKIHFSDKFFEMDTFIHYLKANRDLKYTFEVMTHPAYKDNVLVDFVEDVALEGKLNILLNSYNSALPDAYKTLQTI